MFITILKFTVFKGLNMEAVVTHTYQKMHTICMKSRIISIHELSYMFQQYISILREILIQRNIKLIHPIYIYSVKNKL